MKSNRRHFLKQSSLAMTAVSFNMNDKPVAEMKFVHHALFWIKDKSDTKVYKAILQSLQKFKKIKEVKFFHVGAPSISDVDYEAQATDASYTISYLTLFESKKDKESYLKDPLHLKFFNDFKDVISKVIIFDSLQIEG